MIEWVLYIGCILGWWTEMKRAYNKRPYGIPETIFLLILTPLSPMFFVSDLCRAMSIYVEKNK